MCIRDRAHGRADGGKGPGPMGPGPFAKLLNECVSQRSYFLSASLNSSMNLFLGGDISNDTKNYYYAYLYLANSANQRGGAKRIITIFSIP